MSAANPINATTVIGIFNSRKPVYISGNDSVLDKQVELEIQGKPYRMTALESQEKTPGRSQYFDQYIYSLKANSMEVVQRKETRDIVEAGLKAENEGNIILADELFNEWLNACQLSFSTIDRPGKRVFEPGNVVLCTIKSAVTKAGYTAATVNNVSYVPPVQIANKKFSITDLFGPVTKIQVAAPATADVLG